MNVRMALVLGRVSNLPTIWTNCLAGAWLSNNFIFDYRIFLVLLSMSLLYVSGMFLNDAFDYRVDKKERPERPIPSGKVSQTTVFAWGMLLMLLGLLFFLLSVAGDAGQGNWKRFVSVLFLCVFIVFYDWRHKDNPFSPLLMGACRGAVYLSVGLVYVDVLNIELILASLMGFLWVIGITFLAKQEMRHHVYLWSVPFLLLPFIYTATKFPVSITTLLLSFFLFVAIVYAVVSFKRARPSIAIAVLIAAISLLDGLLLAANGFEQIAWFALFIVPVTLGLQKFIPAT